MTVFFVLSGYLITGILIFAVGVAIGMAKKEKEVSALSAVIAYFVMNTAINAMLTITGQILENGEIAESVLEGVN